MAYYENKLVHIFCVFLCFELSIQDKVLLHIKPHEVLELQREAQVCSKLTGVPAEHLKKLIVEAPEDRATKHFFQCIIHNTGYIDDEGYLVLDRMLVLNVVNGTKEDFEKHIKECRFKKEDVIETAIANSECIRENYVFRPAPK